MAETWLRVRMLWRPSRRSAPTGTISSTVTSTFRAAPTMARSSARGPRICTLPLSSARWAWSDDRVEPQRRDNTDRRSPQSDRRRSRAGTRAIMSEPSGSWNGIDGRFCCAARSAWIMASAVQSRTGIVPLSAAARKRGGRPKMSRLEKQMSISRYRVRFEQQLERQPAGPANVAQILDAARSRWRAAGRSAAGRNGGRRRRSESPSADHRGQPVEIGEDAAGSA